METLIKTKTTANKIAALFDRMDLINIRFYKPSNGQKLSKNELDEEINFYINIRHNENEDPIKMFNNAINKIANV